MSRVARRRALALATTASLAIGLTATTVAADPAQRTVTLVGSLQDEVGCATDWDPACTASALAPQGDGTYAARFEIPEGAYELKWPSTARGTRTTAQAGRPAAPTSRSPSPAPPPSTSGTTTPRT